MNITHLYLDKTKVSKNIFVNWPFKLPVLHLHHVTSPSSEPTNNDQVGTPQ